MRVIRKIAIIFLLLYSLCFLGCNSHIDDDTDIRENSSNENLNVSNLHIVPCQIKKGTSNSWTLEEENAMIDSYLSADSLNMKNLAENNVCAVHFDDTFIDILSKIVSKQKCVHICPAGNELALAPDGGIYPCFTLINKEQNYLLGNAETPSSILKSNIENYINQNMKANIEECVHCWCKHICHTCEGMNVNEHGTITKPVEVECRLVRSRSANIMANLALMKRSPAVWDNFITNLKSYFEKQVGRDYC